MEDGLHPHVNVDEPGPPTSKKRNRTERINYPKKRVSVACEICRSRKTRCDAAKPRCSFCREVGADCVYRNQDDVERSQVQPEPPTSLTSSTQSPIVEEHDIITRLSRIERLLQQPHTPSVRPEHASPLHDVAVVSPSSTHGSHFNSRMVHRRELQTSIGINLGGLSRLFNRPCPQQLQPLISDDFEEQIELHMQAGETMFQDGPIDLSTLNLSPRRCWQLQQTFARDVLPWCPILDQQTCAELVARTAEGTFTFYSAEGPLTLFILALGAFAQESQCLDDDPRLFAGLDYFRAGCQLIDADRSSANTVFFVQSHIFMSFYLLYALRPFQAFESIRSASEKVLLLLQLRSRLAADDVYREMVHRAYWACYLIEHELQGYFPYSALLLQDLHEDVPLPMSDYDEPGIYWFLSEIALRRLFSRPRHGINWNMHILYEPVIVDEIASQMMQWHSSLPQPVKFALEDSVTVRPLLDPHKTFLRAQFYAIMAILFWQYVVRLLTGPLPEDISTSEQTSRKSTRIRDAAAQSLRYACIHVYAVESLFHHRHLMLIANYVGLYTIEVLMITIYDSPELASIQPPQMKDAILKGYQSLKIWAENRAVRRDMSRVEDLLKSKGLIETF